MNTLSAPSLAADQPQSLSRAALGFLSSTLLMVLLLTAIA
jgi:hypothetical protein